MLHDAQFTRRPCQDMDVRATGRGNAKGRM
jgi:hypothetical protein